MAENVVVTEGQKSLSQLYGHHPMKRLLLIALLFSTPALADSWQERPEYVEWNFKLGVVSVALEQCPFTQGLRYRELSKNAQSIKPKKKVRTYEEGREMILILDGPDKSALCATALKFFGPTGTDLSGVLAMQTSEDGN